MNELGHSPPPPPGWLHRADELAAPPPTPPAVPVKASLANREPVALGAAGQALITATLSVLVGFKVWSPTGEQIGLILALYTAVVGFVTAWTRGRAWSPASVAKLVDDR